MAQMLTTKGKLSSASSLPKAASPAAEPSPTPPASSTKILSAECEGATAARSTLLSSSTAPKLSSRGAVAVGSGGSRSVPGPRLGSAPKDVSLLGKKKDVSVGEVNKGGGGGRVFSKGADATAKKDPRAGEERASQANTKKAYQRAFAQAALTQEAVYDGIHLKLNGEVLIPRDKRRRLVRQARVLPHVTAIHDGVMYWGHEESVLEASGAFQDCCQLRCVVLPEKLTVIGDYAFTGCTSLSSIALPAGLTKIGESALRGCTSISFITIPDGVTTIGDGALSGCRSLSTIIMPKGLTKLGSYSFSGCTSLHSVTLPPHLKKIGVDAFRDCTILEQRSRVRSQSVAQYVFSLSRRILPRRTVLSCLARMRDELQEGSYIYVDSEGTTPANGTIEGRLAFQMITSDDLWRFMLEFL